MNTEWAPGDRARRKPPLREWQRRRLTVVAAIGVIWVLLIVMTGRLLAGTLLLVLSTCVAIAGWAIARSLGIDAHHPLVRRVRQRPWRDPRMIIDRAARALPTVLIIGVAGKVLAPANIEIALNPADLNKLARHLALDLVEQDLTERYLTAIREYAATAAGEGAIWVSLRSDPCVPLGTGRPRSIAALRRPPAPLPPGRPAVPSNEASTLVSSTPGRARTQEGPTVLHRRVR